MNIIVAVALILNSLSPGFMETPIFQKPAASTTPSIQVKATFDKKKNVTTLYLPPLQLWSNRNPDQAEQVRLFVGFECPGTKIVTPKEVTFWFSATSQNFVSFPSLKFSVLLDGTLLELGDLKGNQRKQINSPKSSTVYDDESIIISYEDFTRIASANSVTIIVGKRKFDLSSGAIQFLREFQKLMEREGQEIK